MLLLYYTTIDTLLVASQVNNHITSVDVTPKEKCLIVLQVLSKTTARAENYNLLGAHRYRMPPSDGVGTVR